MAMINFCSMLSESVFPVHGLDDEGRRDSADPCFHSGGFL